MTERRRRRSVGLLEALTSVSIWASPAARRVAHGSQRQNALHRSA
ncbi:hypothetical protein [Nocardia fusca]|nr:hypothetical protein [Nocardia fusca]